MDGQKFDALVRNAASSRSRRDVVRTVGAGAVAAALAGVGLRQATAQTVDPAACTGPRQTCDTNSECCGGGKNRCDRISQDCNKNRLKRDDRCCGKNGARCADSCDCCRDLTCDTTQNRCVKR